MKNIILLKYERVTAESAFAVYALETLKQNDDEPTSYDVRLLPIEVGMFMPWRVVGGGSALLDGRQCEGDLPDWRVEDLADPEPDVTNADLAVARRVGELLDRDAKAKKEAGK